MFLKHSKTSSKTLNEHSTKLFPQTINNAFVCVHFENINKDHITLNKC